MTFCGSIVNFDLLDHLQSSDLTAISLYNICARKIRVESFNSCASSGYFLMLNTSLVQQVCNKNSLVPK